MATVPTFASPHLLVPSVAVPPTTLWTVMDKTVAVSKGLLGLGEKHQYKSFDHLKHTTAFVRLTCTFYIDGRGWHAMLICSSGVIQCLLATEPHNIFLTIHISTDTLVLFTQRRRIISGVVVSQFSTNGDSHRSKHLRLKDKLLCNSHRMQVLWPLKRRDGTHNDDDIGVFLRCFLGVPPVNLNPQIVYNDMDAVIMCSDWNPDPLNIVESDKVMFFALNYIIK